MKQASPATRSLIESITAYVQRHPGTKGAAVRKALKIGRRRWTSAAFKAIAQERIRKEGARKVTKYWPA